MTFAAARTIADIVIEIEGKTAPARGLVVDAKVFAQHPATYREWALEPERVERKIQKLRGLTALVKQIEEMPCES